LEFAEHAVQWTDEKVARFWDHFNRSGAREYFAEQVGEAVITIATTKVPVAGMVLDFGSGKGALIGKLLERGGMRVSGCDFSPASVEFVKTTYRGRRDFAECTLIEKLPTPFPANHFDCIFLLETVEHLIHPHLEQTVAELQRLLKPGGSLVVTTPNQENLTASEVMCPDCGAIFHRVQHVRTFDTAAIRELFERGGLEEVFCRALFLGSRKQQWLAGIAGALKMVLGRSPFSAPNLMYIGRKP
jgi:2-polyprenyl-3-methyl-5-hydroxy-6-metoxy-1,4-benzoquinol methylase